MLPDWHGRYQLQVLAFLWLCHGRFLYVCLQSLVLLLCLHFPRRPGGRHWLPRFEWLQWTMQLKKLLPARAVWRPCLVLLRCLEVFVQREANRPPVLSCLLLLPLHYCLLHRSLLNLFWLLFLLHPCRILLLLLS